MKEQAHALSKQIASAVKGKRILLGISQEELAEKAELHRTYVSDVERGARNISLATLSKLAGALGMRVSELVAYAESLEFATASPVNGRK